MQQQQRIIIKIGTNVLTKPDQSLNTGIIHSMVSEIALFKQQTPNLDCLIVTSGAITTGAHHLCMTPETLKQKQAAASVGQILLFHHYFSNFNQHGIAVGQLLVTKDNFDDPTKKSNISQTIDTLLEFKTIPIINENDSVSTDEIQFGDNDQLAVILAKNIQATSILFLTNTHGVLDETDTIIPHLSSIGERELALTKRPNSTVSKGGMTSKLMAAKEGLANGIHSAIANGQTPGTVTRFLNGEHVGTMVSA